MKRIKRVNKNNMALFLKKGHIVMVKKSFTSKVIHIFSQIPGHCIEMVNLGALTLLQRVYMKHSSSVVFRRHIAWILGNLALNQNLHKNIIDGGRKIPLLSHLL